MTQYTQHHLHDTHTFTDKIIVIIHLGDLVFLISLGGGNALGSAGDGVASAVLNTLNCVCTETDVVVFQLIILQ